MTLFERKSFTVPASAGSASYCAEHGHTLPDQRGKCLRCGDDTSVGVFLELIDATVTPPMRVAVEVFNSSESAVQFAAMHAARALNHARTTTAEAPMRADKA